MAVSRRGTTDRDRQYLIVPRAKFQKGAAAVTCEEQAGELANLRESAQELWAIRSNLLAAAQKRAAAQVQAQQTTDRAVETEVAAQEQPQQPTTETPTQWTPAVGDRVAYSLCGEFIQGVLTNLPLQGHKRNAWIVSVGGGINRLIWDITELFAVAGVAA
jgi:hypothetical protein